MEKLQITKYDEVSDLFENSVHISNQEKTPKSFMAVNNESVLEKLKN